MLEKPELLNSLQTRGFIVQKSSVITSKGFVVVGGVECHSDASFSNLIYSAPGVTMARFR